MSNSNPQNKMRSVAFRFDGIEIEFGHEPEKFFARIIREKLPLGRNGGMAAHAQKQKSKESL